MLDIWSPAGQLMLPLVHHETCKFAVALTRSYTRTQPSTMYANAACSSTWSLKDNTTCPICKLHRKIYCLLQMPVGSQTHQRPSISAAAEQRARLVQQHARHIWDARPAITQPASGSPAASSSHGPSSKPYAAAADGSRCSARSAVPASG